MDMLWDQLTKVKKVKCQDWNKLWKNFLQEPNTSFKKVEKTSTRLGENYSKKKLKKEIERRGYGDEMPTEVTEGNRNPR